MKNDAWVKMRAAVLALLLVALFGVILWRAGKLHLVEGPRLKQLSERQHQRSLTLVPRRGTIYDRNREELALSLDVKSVFIRPRKADLDEAGRDRLRRALGLSRKEMDRRVAGKKGFVWLKRRVSAEEEERVRALDLRGIGFINERQRFYPNITLAGHLLGFAGVDSHGLEGVELHYDRYLRGSPEFILFNRDALGRRIFLQFDRSLRLDPKAPERVPGANLAHVELNVSKRLQFVAEQALRRSMESTKARRGLVLMMDPRNGEVLALAIAPEFNPNLFWKYEPGAWRNDAVAGVFEPGSTFKVFTVAAALEEGVARITDKIFAENGSWRVADRIIHDVKPRGSLTVREVLIYSSNIGAAKLGERLGAKRFYYYTRRFGFGRHTGIDLPGEVSGLVPPLSRWRKVELATISFGQGISVTPVQLLAAFCSVINGGKLWRPFVARRVVDESGEQAVEFSPKLIGRTISEKTSRQMVGLLTDVVNGPGTGRRARLAHVEALGKTGTAQKVDPKGGYYQDRWMSSFIGAFPPEDPRVAILVVLDEPQGPFYGGVVAAPVFKEVAERTMGYLNLAYRGEKKPARKPAPAMVLRTVKGLEVAPAEWRTGRRRMRLPDFGGWSMREVLKEVSRRDLRLEVLGSGVAVGQHPKAGSWVERGALLQVSFQPPA